MSNENSNFAFAGAFVDELHRCGVEHACICPGSRSSPLAISFFRQAGIRTWVHLDERSASFFGLGMGKASRSPVALLCSSGTAAGNFYPAVVEASFSGIPLIVLTADRPPELHGWGALQTIDQERMYGSHARWSYTMPVPEPTSQFLAQARNVADRAFATALSPMPGPVHLNFPFREPLEPVQIKEDQKSLALCTGDTLHGRSRRLPFLSKATGLYPAENSEGIDGLAKDLARQPKGIIVCGPGHERTLGHAAALLASRTGYPVLADPLSQVRCGPHDLTRVIDRYDFILQEKSVLSSLAPELVIRIGQLPTSKALWEYLAANRQARHILVDSNRMWSDPFHVSSEIWHCDATRFCNALAGSLGNRNRAGEWAKRWKKFSLAADQAIRQEMRRRGLAFEGKAFHRLANLLPDGSSLFVGNSMCVRDLDAFFPSAGKSINFMANRGASGIDGVVSSALGASAVTTGPLVLVIGDISFYHDMNGLFAARAFDLAPTIIVLNNDGGGIFSFLPQAHYEESFEKLFGTPHGLMFEHAAALHGYGYARPKEWRAFDAAVRKGIASRKPNIVEVIGERRENFEQHRQVRAATLNAIRKAGRQ